MSSAVNVEVNLVLNDRATAGARAAAQGVQQETNKVTTATERMAQKAADSIEKGTTRQRSSYERLSQARETLGVKSERAIQREIQQTEAAYNRLKMAGFSSWNEQAAAAEKMREKVTKLTNEMGRLTTAQKAYGALKFSGAAIAGIGAAAYTLKAPASAAMSYDMRLADMANTAYAERDKAGRQIGMKELEGAVNKARREGGGTRDQAADALDTMIASGTVSDQEAIAMLPGIMKAATAGNTDANALATIAIRAKQSFKIGVEDIPKILSAALAAGQAGGFELKDMAKWLPQQMAMAKNLGISGKDGFAKLASWNQASVVTAGTKDEAGNNLRDLLNELNTPHFRNFMAEQYLANGQKAKKGQKEGRLKTVDQLFLDYQDRGVDKVEATLDMMNTIFSKNKTYQSLQTKLQGLSKDDKEGRRDILEAMAAQVQGTAVGKVFHNQQSLMAFLGLMNNADYTKDVLGKVRAEYGKKYSDGDNGDGESAIGIGFSVKKDTAGYKVQQAEEDKLLGQKAAMDSLTPAIGKAAEAFSDLAAKHPLLVGTTILATTALGALAGAAGLASIAMGGKGLPGGGAISRFASGMASSGIGRTAMQLGKVGTIGGIGALAGGYALDKTFGEESAVSRYGSSMMNGAALGGTIGSFVPLAGTAIGALIGGLGGAAWEAYKDLSKGAEQKAVDAKPAEMNAKFTVGLAPGLVLQGQSFQATGANVSLNTGNIMTGAPH
ncbi:phage tail tape measure protein [Herbaspirillum sp.]|uniref:phage tail tape measure protein n=1 Tax=Herbaspirillum sp. TaxID=1890675 RepID=UPI0025C37826|nr:phage tail tape measure protein [Herbaspirillum sp.]